MNQTLLTLVVCFLLSLNITAQDVLIQFVEPGKERLLSRVAVSNLSGHLIGESDVNGRLVVTRRSDVKGELIAFKPGYETVRFRLPQNSDSLRVLMRRLQVTLAEHAVRSSREQGVKHLRPVEGTSIFSGMKSEVIRPHELAVDVGVNSGRQLYSSIPGLNIWENDAAGIQLAIGARGLSPNRTSHFNVRQDMHDISADALGYPESYYTPNLMAVDRIEVVRGAAALQFGTQFGGLLNFRMKRAPREDGYEVQLYQGLSSYGANDSLTSLVAASNSFASVGFRSRQHGLFISANYKQGDGWRPNSGYELINTYLSYEYALSADHDLEIGLTHMAYLAQQAGGLTDQQFDDNPRASFRDRNWFEVNWNMATIMWSYRPSSAWELSSRTFGLLAERNAVGYLGQTQRPDPSGNRDILTGDFKNIGNETRVLHRILGEERITTISGGIRLYRGTNRSAQGAGSAEDDADFSMLSNVPVESTDYFFPNTNVALFSQVIIPIGEHFRISPGARYEHIKTESDGRFRSLIFNGAGGVIEDTTLNDSRSRTRDFALFGVSLSYQLGSYELYANAVENYRAVNFSDIQIRNTSLRIDPEITDERGANFDVGVRSNRNGNLQLDASVFMLNYYRRIGEYFTRDELNRAVRYRTNVADARSFGMELYAQYEIGSLLFPDTSDHSVVLFLNTAVMNGTYERSENSTFRGNALELVPDHTIRAGLRLRGPAFGGSVQYSAIGEQFSDASNVGVNPDFPATLNGVDGIIPAYHVMDASMNWGNGSWLLQFSVNNMTDERYFTRRATGYPGPGIIPSDGRSYTFSIQYTITHND